jgi:hypothetical protein
MSSSIAALIGAGLGVVAAFTAQYISHRFSADRERRNRRREQLDHAVVEAALALHRAVPPRSQVRKVLATGRGLAVPPRERRRVVDQLTEWIGRPWVQRPGLFRIVDDSSVLLEMLEAADRASTILTVHLGAGHPLTAAYWETCFLWQDVARSHDPDFVSVREVSREERHSELMAAQRALDAWVTQARAVADRI